MKLFSKDWWRDLKHKFQERRRRSRLSALKRRTEYLFLNPRLFWQKLKVRLHPQSLWSYFTSKRGLWTLFQLFFSCIILILTVLTLGYVYYRYSLDINLVAETDCLEYRTLEFYDRSGEQLLWRHSEGGVCYPITLDEVSPYFIDGLIVIEDKDFYSHPGFKLTSIGRAVLNNIRGRPLQGGSTITQQYVKNAILRDGKRNFDRKIKEAILVPEIEHLYTKDQILTAYLNTVFLGNNYSGIEAASRGYFDKKSRHLTLDEAALLVGTIQAPNAVWDDPQLHLRRRNIVLQEMLKDKKITQKQYDKAFKVDTLAKIIPENIAPSIALATRAPHSRRSGPRSRAPPRCAPTRPGLRWCASTPSVVSVRRCDSAGFLAPSSSSRPAPCDTALPLRITSTGLPSKCISTQAWDRLPVHALDRAGIGPCVAQGAARLLHGRVDRVEHAIGSTDKLDPKETTWMESS